MYTGDKHHDGRERYAQFLRDTPFFTAAILRVFEEWPKSCEHFLTNASLNRVAWLGQASMSIATGVPRDHRSGFMLLTEAERNEANATAELEIARWLRKKSASTSSGGGTKDIQKTSQMWCQMSLWPSS